MRLRVLRIDRLPGIDRSFEYNEEDLGAGLNLVLGPNGSGKSTSCRAIRALLWPRAEDPQQLVLAARWELDDGSPLEAERTGSAPTTWRREGLPAAAPPLPDAHLAGCFQLSQRDLLDAGETEERLALALRRQAAGGHDLESLLAARERPPGPQGLQRDRRAARERLRKLLDEQEALRGRQLELGALEGRRLEARKARAELELVKGASRLAAGRARLEELDGEIEALPPGVERLEGQERQLLDGLDEELAGLREQLAKQRSRAAKSRRVLRAAGLAAGPLAETELAELTERARAIERLAEAQRGARREEAEAGAALEETRRQLGGSAADGRPLDAAALDRVEALVAEREALARRRAELEAETARLTEVAGAAGSPADLQRATEGLRAWLAAPAPALRWLALALALALAGFGAWLARESAAAGWLVAVAALAAGSLALYLGGPARRRPREELGTGTEAPARWERAAVEQHLRGLERELARSLRGAEAAAEGERLAAALERLQDDERAHAEARRALAEEAGLAEPASTSGLAVLLRRLQDLDTAAARLAAARAAGTELGGKLDEGLAVLAERLRRTGAQVLEPEAAPAPPPGSEPGSELGSELGSEPGSEPGSELASEMKLQPVRGRQPVDAAAARAAVEALAARCHEAGEADRRRREALEDAAGDRARRDALRSRRGRLLEKAGLSETENGAAIEAELDRRLAALPELRRLSEERRAIERAIAEDEAALTGREELLELDAATASARAVELEELAASWEDLVEEIAGIEKEVQQAERAESVQSLLAEIDGLEERLADHREQALDAAAGRVLLGRVEQQHETESRPAVLERATALLAAFTHHRHGLETFKDEDGRARFRALDLESGRRLALSELSDGTRSQLLLAVRLAFVEEAERGERLPLFLDEALSNSDPVRFRAVALALLGLVREEGRQVFYLTCEPGEVERWNAVAAELGLPRRDAVDLAALRRLAAAGEGPASYAAPERRAIPAPGGRSPEDYAHELGVPRFDPRWAIEELPLFYALSDELDLLHRLLELGLERGGPLRSWARAPGAAEALGGGAPGAEALERAEAGLAVAEAFLEAWSVGRGRPVDRASLDAGGVSGTFLDSVDELATRHDRDAKRLLRALEPGSPDRPPRFHAKTAEKLAEHLEREGLLDPRELLDEAGLRARMLSRLAGRLSDGSLQGALVTQRTDWYLALADGGVSAGAGAAG